MSQLITNAERDGVIFRVVADQLLFGTTKKNAHWLDAIEPHRAEILNFLTGQPLVDTAGDDEPQPALVALPFPTQTLPDPVAAFVKATAAAIGCEPSFVALPILAALARAIGNKRVIRLSSEWTEPAVIWAAIVGKSGTHKTPAMKAARVFLARLQANEFDSHRERAGVYQQELLQYNRDLQAWTRSKNSTTPPPSKPDEPVCVRYVTTDCTIEALAAILAVQYDGVLVERDELAGWLGSFGQYKGGGGGDSAQWLETWSAGSLTIDRKTGVTKVVHVPRAAVSLIGGIQPGVLRRAISHHLEDGLCARLLFTMPEPRRVVWTEATVHPAVKAAMGNTIDAMIALAPTADDDGRDSPVALELTPEAKRVWVRHYNQHSDEMVDLDDDLAAAWSKLRAYTARLALIIQLATDPNSQGIDQLAIEAAIELIDWFKNEARRVYSLFVDDRADQEQRELVEWIRRHGGETTVRDLSHGPRKFKGKAADAETALEELRHAGLGDWATLPPGAKGGRPTRIFRLGTTAPGTETSRNTGDKGVSVPVPVVPVPPHETNGRAGD